MSSLAEPESEPFCQHDLDLNFRHCAVRRGIASISCAHLNLIKRRPDQIWDIHGVLFVHGYQSGLGGASLLQLLDMLTMPGLYRTPSARWMHFLTMPTANIFAKVT